LKGVTGVRWLFLGGWKLGKIVNGKFSAEHFALIVTSISLVNGGDQWGVQLPLWGRFDDHLI